MNRFILKYPTILQKLYPSRISKITKEKTIYLSFDDGPIPEVTPWVLQTLANFSAKATFFCIGNNIKKHPDVFQEIITSNHTIGNHTFNHLNGWRTKLDHYIENIAKTDAIINEYKAKTISENKFFRPPYGRIKNKQAKKLQKLGYKIVMWDVISGDYDQTYDAEKCLKNCIKLITPGSVVVFHDSLKAQKNLIYVLPKLMEYYAKKGWSFENL
ncbi:polysaccharide deacetylase family protein [Zunongwangia sp.]|uniref:polysaccharide deacetylase family protein n=1 Tax=Zunongwangia sp. TaxID=1965325 RepID=UPI003AA98875